MLNTMWGFGNHANDASDSQSPVKLGRGQKTKRSMKSPGKKLRSTPKKLANAITGGSGSRTPGSRSKSSRAVSTGGVAGSGVASTAKNLLSFAFSEESIEVSETNAGLEVALDWKAATSTPVAKASINFDLRRASKMHKCQFSMNYPIMPMQAKGSTRKRPEQPRHRVPLTDPVESASLQDLVFQLQSHSVKDEVSSVRDEIHRLDAEILALEEDRTELEHEYLRLPNSVSDAPMWDFDYLLKHQKPSAEDVQELQRRRGRCWTLQLQSMNVRDTLSSTLGLASSSPTKRTNKYKSRVTVTAGTNNVSQLCLVPGNNSQTAYFLHTDRGTSHGHVPPRLWARMKKAALQKDMLTYLSTGPNGAYFATFSSGHVWWGMADPDFEAIVKAWPVHRVTFGPATRVSKQDRLYSWMVVSRDGRVAFKNLPLRLTNTLNSRLADESAPAEISLGGEGAYFIRFLDGSVDYCLPAHASEVCNYIQSRGGKLTNILLHPQLSKDIIIRHTELKC